MTKLRQQLATYTDHFLSASTSPGTLFTAGAGLKSLMTELTNEVISQEDAQANIQTDGGVAISASFALKCIEDIYRTRAFCSGLFEAITEKIEEYPSKTVQVLYAGCGPFATLMLPVISKFTSDQVRFTLLEINPSSVKILNKVLAALDLNEYVQAIHNSDALDFTVSSPEAFDILVTETMQAGLKNEPQVAMSYKLMAQLNSQAILIPQEVALHFYLVSDLQRSNYKLGKEMANPYYEDLGAVFVLNAQTIEQHKKLFQEQYPDVEFPEVVIELPKGAQRKYDAVMIGTEVHVFNEHRLSIDESGITVLIKALDFKESMLRFKTLAAQYICDQQPGLDISVVN